MYMSKKCDEYFKYTMEKNSVLLSGLYSMTK